ncbi:MAG TPA: DEAD/DEAH box helicase [Planctomycetaceae bacterium]|nr:DEAD/DEAH box helicase [Planctomycetaceae bacterium]
MAVTRDDLAQRYFDQLPFTPYPVQEDALLAWFSSDTGVLVCAPTGTGKTLIAEAALFEALHTGRKAYYTTPLIALTDQKFLEMQAAAERWGFDKNQVGLVTGNRKVNPEATVLVVVAEILLNRLLHTEAFDFSDVSAVVMDEFHSFSDIERGIVWEFALSMLPKHVRLLLLSATIGNAVDFVLWLDRCHGRRLELVQGTERKIPLSFRWVPDKLLTEHLEEMAAGDAETRRTPALVFCFNRDECWNVAEELKGKSMLADGQQKALGEELAKHDWSKGVGPKLKQILFRGVGVHHAGLLPKHKRVVEHLFQRKLLSICVCTETLAAGINLPARSVVLPCLLKGKPGQQKIIEPSAAHQMFGRAGRPQFDKEGFVFALPHEDDVRILRWKERYDQIPEDTKDPLLLKAKKALKKKMPTRSPERQYWNESQFDKLRIAPPGALMSRGPLPWRLLAYLLQLSPDVDRLRTLVRKRLMDPKQLDAGEKHLEEMLLTLYAGDYVRLEPEPPPPPMVTPETAAAAEPAQAATSWLSQQLQTAMNQQWKAQGINVEDQKPESARYRPLFAYPTEKLAQLLIFRSVNPLYGLFLMEHLGVADRTERILLWESLLEFPMALIKHVRVPPPHKLPPGPLALTKVDPEIVSRGLIAAQDLYPEFDPDIPFEDRKYAPPLADKVKLWFDAVYPEVHELRTTPVWCAGELLEFGGNFYNYVSSRDLSKQEGLVFRHVLRLVLLLGEFAQLTPPDVDPQVWREELQDLAAQWTEACRGVDPTSTDHMLVHAADPDLVALDVPVQVSVLVDVKSPTEPVEEELEFGAGLDNGE